MKCPLCGADATYVGLFDLKCGTRSCKNGDCVPASDPDKTPTDDQWKDFWEGWQHKPKQTSFAFACSQCGDVLGQDGRCIVCD